MKLRRIFILLMIITVAFIIGNIGEVKAATVPSFSIRVYTVDYNTGARTSSSQYSMEIPGYGVVTTYNMGTTGTDYKTGYTSDGTYTLRQSQTSTGGYGKVSDVKLTVTRNSQGKITNVTTNKSSSEASVTWSNGSVPEVSVTIKEKKTTYQSTFSIGLKTTDKSSGSLISGSSYRIKDIWSGAYKYYDIGSNGSVSQSGFYTPSSSTTYLYTIEQTKNSTNYNTFGNISLYVTFNSYGAITNAYSYTSNVSVSYTSSSVTVTTKETKTATNYQSNFSIGLKTTDKSSGSLISGSSYRIKDVWSGAYKYYDIGSNGSVSQSGFYTPSSSTTYLYTIEQTKNSTNYNTFGNIALYVTFNSYGAITNAYSYTGNVNVSYTSSSVTVTTKETKTTTNYQSTFSIGLKTTDKDSGSLISGSSYRIKDVWSGVYKYYDIGSNGSVSQSGFYTSSASTTYLYTIEQTKNSTNYNTFGNISLYVTFNSYGVITNAYTYTNNVNVSYTSSSVTVTTRETKTTQNKFTATVSTVDKSTGSTTTGSSYTLQSPNGYYNYYYSIGSTNTNTIDASLDRGTTYKLKQNSPTNGYDRLSDTNIYVYTYDNGKIYYVSSNNSDVTVTYTESSISIRIKETKTATNPTQSTFSIGLKTTDKDSGNLISGSSYRIKDISSGAYKTYNIGSNGFVSQSGFTTFKASNTYTYTIEQTKASTGYNSFENISLYITFNTNGTITNAVSTTKNVSVALSGNEIIVTTKETKIDNQIPTPQSIAIGITTVNKSDKSKVSGGTYVIQPSQGSSMTYVIGSSGTASNNFTSLPAGTYTYTVKQTTPSTGYESLSNMEFYVTYNSNGLITKVNTNSSNLGGSYNTTYINLEILETKKDSTKPIVPNTAFSMTLTSQDFTTGAKTTGAKYTLKAPNGSTIDYDMGTTGTATKSNISTLAAGTHTFTLIQTTSSNGYNKVVSIDIYITFDSTGKITNVTTSNADAIVNSYANNSISISIKERKSTNFTISISTPGYSTGTLTLQTPSGETKNYTMSNGTYSYSDFTSLGAGKYTYTIKNASYITGSTSNLNIYVTFDSNGQIINVSTDNRSISGNYNSNNISLYVSK